MDEKEQKLSTKFDCATTPGVLLEEPGLLNQIPISMSEALKITYKHTDLIHLTDSHDIRLYSWLSQQKTLDVFSQAGASCALLEIPKNITTKNIATDFLFGNISREEFVNEMRQAGAGLNKDTAAYLNLLADFIRNSKHAGLTTSFVNPENAAKEWQAAQTAQKKGNVPQEELNELWRVAHLVRTDDRALAKNVELELQPHKGKQPKCFIFYGGAHGSRRSDFEEFISKPSLRFSVYLDTENYKRDVEYMRQINEREKTCFGEDKPELVYFIEGNAVYTTVETPAKLAEELMQAALASQAPVAPQTQDHSSQKLPVKPNF